MTGLAFRTQGRVASIRFRFVPRNRNLLSWDLLLEVRTIAKDLSLGPRDPSPDAQPAGNRMLFAQAIMTPALRGQTCQGSGPESNPGWHVDLRANRSLPQIASPGLTVMFAAGACRTRPCVRYDGLAA